MLLTWDPDAFGTVRERAKPAQNGNLGSCLPLHSFKIAAAGSGDLSTTVVLRNLLPPCFSSPGHPAVLQWGKAAFCILGPNHSQEVKITSQG